MIHKFKYYNKYFRAGELTVWDYMLFLHDPEYAMEKVLLEFNKEIPNMSEKHVRAFYKILFRKGDDLEDVLAKKKPEDLARMLKKNKKILDDMHIFIGMICKNIPWFTLQDVLNMPLTGYEDILEDLKIIVWQEKYNPNRVKTSDPEYKKPDKKAFKALSGQGVQQS